MMFTDTETISPCWCSPSVTIFLWNKKENPHVRIFQWKSKLEGGGVSCVCSLDINEGIVLVLSFVSACVSSPPSYPPSHSSSHHVPTLWSTDWWKWCSTCSDVSADNERITTPPPGVSESIYSALHCNHLLFSSSQPFHQAARLRTGELIKRV